MKTSILWVGLFLAGCVSAPPPAPRPMQGPANASEYGAFEGDGTLELRGQAFLTTRGGDVKLGAGRMVTLDPATTYSTEWFRRFGGDVEDFGALPPDRRFRAARRTTTADAEGRFTFSRLMPGTYLIRTTVTWEVGDAEQGGVVAMIVTVPADENVILSEVYTTGYVAALGVPIVGEAELSARRFRVITEVSAVSCRAGLIDPGPTEAEARDKLVIEAARVPEADAVARVACRRAGLNLSCTSRVICEGVAIAWTS